MRKVKGSLKASDKTVLWLCFCLGFSGVILFALNYCVFFKLCHKTEAWFFVSPSTISILSFVVLVFSMFLFLLSFYEKTISKGLSLNNSFALIKTKKWVLKTILLLSFFIITVCINSICFYGASNDGLYRNGKLIFHYEQVEMVEVDINEVQIASGLKAIFHKPVIRCRIYAKDIDWQIDSDYFYGFKEVYAFIKRIPVNKRIISPNYLSELIEYLQKRRIKEEELVLVKSIFNQ